MVGYGKLKPHKSGKDMTSIFTSADELSVPKNVRKNPFQYTIAFNSKIFPHVVKL